MGSRASQTSVARGGRNNGTVTPTIKATIATTLAITVTPPNVMTHRASLSRRQAFRLETVFNVWMGHKSGRPSDYFSRVSCC